jgi:Protein of unknown function (DUF3108)
MFHNTEMNRSMIFRTLGSPSFRIGAFSALISVIAHAVFLAWARGSIELPTWNAPVMDTPVQVTLVEPVIKQAPTPEPPPKSIERPSSKPSPRPPANKPLNKTEPYTGVSPVAPPVDRVIDKLPDKDISEAQPAPLVPELDPPKTETAKPVDLYPGGLGALKESAAYPYKFYFGDYSDNNVLGSAFFVVESTPSDYKLAIVGKASGLTSLLFSGATYRSEGVFNNDGFAPVRYAEKSGNRAERQSSVDYAAKEVTLGDQKKPVLQGMQDRVSVIWQVGLVLRARPEFSQPGKALPIPLMSTRSLESAQFVSQGLVRLERNGQAIDAVHFRFQPTNNQNKAQIDLWYELDKLPQPLRVRWIDERQRTIDILRDD